MEIGTVITTTVKNAKASECLKCGLCEQICPQHLHIRDLLVEVAQTFKKILKILLTLNSSLGL